MLWSLTEQVYKMIGTSPVQDTISRGKANDNKSRYCMCLIFAEFKNWKSIDFPPKDQIQCRIVNPSKFSYNFLIYILFCK